MDVMRRLVYPLCLAATVAGCSGKDRDSASTASGVAPSSSLLFTNQDRVWGTGASPGKLGGYSGGVASSGTTGATPTPTTSGTTGGTTPAFAPGSVTPIGAGTPNTPATDPYANVGSRFWHENNTLGQPLKTHSAEQGQLAQQVALAINAERQKAGLTSLRVEGTAIKAAKVHSEDMLGRGYFDHLTPEGWTPRQRHQMVGGGNARKVAENLLKGLSDPLAIVAQWMASPGHRQNILDPDINEVGVGIASTDPYVTALFVQR